MTDPTGKLALIRAHLKCAQEGHAVHVACLGEATWNEDSEDYYCHQCEMRVPFGTVCDPPGQDYYEHDVGFLLALVDATAKSNAHAIAELCGQVNDLRGMFDTTRHRILERMGEDDLGKSWSWVEDRLRALIEIEKYWSRACDVAKANCAPFAREPGDSFIFDGIPRMAADYKLEKAERERTWLKLRNVTKERDEQTLRANRSEADVAMLNAKLGYLTHELAEDETERAVVWYVRGPEGEFEEHYSESDARSGAEAMLEHYRENAADDGWPSDIDCLEWGKLEPKEVAEVDAQPAPEGSSFDEFWSVGLRPTHVGRDE